MAGQGFGGDRLVKIVDTFRRPLAAAALAASLSGCGLEALLVEAGSDEHVIPVTTVRGSVANLPETIVLTRPDGEEVEPVEFEATGGNYVLDLPDAEYVNARLTAADADGTLMVLVPRIEMDSVLDGVDIDTRSTAAALIVDAAAAAGGVNLQVVDPCVLGVALDGIAAEIDDQGPAAEVLAALDVSGPTAPDAALAAAAAGVSLEGVIDPVLIRTVLEVNFNEGQVDGNCDGISRFRWVRDEPGKQMYFVGGLHEDSPVQDLEYNEPMGSGSGSWTPNQIPMFDDGTNGDEVAGDNIWTLTLDLPRGARIGYKYTWGQQGQLWTGTEEWPGNQRILEIEDINGDNFVRRRDNFADEASNKDKANLNRQGMGEIDWESDVNDDGIADARERPLDLDNDCTLDDWVTPTAIGPATVACE